MKEYRPIKVCCHAGYRGEEYPKSFTWDHKTVEVKEIEKRWLEQGFRFFQVISDDGGLFFLRYREQDHRWEGRTLKRKEPD